MKSRSVCRVKPDHAAATAAARAERGRWVLACIYFSSASAKSAAHCVPGAERMPAYQPAGAYEAYAAPCDDGTALWVRYVAEEEPVPAMPDGMTVRVRHDGDGPGYSGVGIHTVTISTRCPRCGGPRGYDAIRPHRFHHDGAWFTVDRWTNPCGHTDLYEAVLSEARERPLPATTPAEAPAAPAADSPAGLILAAAKARRVHHAKQAAQLLDDRGHHTEAERIRAEIKARHGHLSAKQAVGLLLSHDQPEGGTR
ncbi:hypothetical protein ACFV27_00570 [Streptomyces antimycoticus]|uniref:hypothetical protein n=1 Tax=Streptomyces antimycoticus TaxID=68175 RepID=UPI0036B9E832